MISETAGPLEKPAANKVYIWSFRCLRESLLRSPARSAIPAHTKLFPEQDEDGESYTDLITPLRCRDNSLAGNPLV